MTIDEAKKDIEDALCNNCLPSSEAIEMAIASFEAWKKVKAEIDEQYDRVHPYNISCAEGLEMALEIIDRHLRKVLESEGIRNE